MLTENEILDRHRLALSEARDACQWLARNADPERAAPRGHHYRSLRAALNALEGSCRQMAQWREDARWLKLGFLYARTMRVAQVNFQRMNWTGFAQLAPLFTDGLKRMDDLATLKTLRAAGPILPKRTEFMQMPQLVLPKRAVRTGTMH